MFLLHQNCINKVQQTYNITYFNIYLIGILLLKLQILLSLILLINAKEIIRAEI